jgi:hypothetical protein
VASAPGLQTCPGDDVGRAGYGCLVELTRQDGLRLRMVSLLAGGSGGPADLVPGGFQDVASVVEWFGAMQAQDLASALWSVGVRLPKLTRRDVEQALERGEALRTWPTGPWTCSARRWPTRAG